MPSTIKLADASGLSLRADLYAIGASDDPNAPTPVEQVTLTEVRSGRYEGITNQTVDREIDIVDTSDDFVIQKGFIRPVDGGTALVAENQSELGSLTSLETELGNVKKVGETIRHFNATRNETEDVVETRVS